MGDLSLVNLKSINKQGDRIVELEKRILVVEQKLIENDRKNTESLALYGPSKESFKRIFIK